MNRIKNISTILPPDLIPIQKSLTPTLIEKLKNLSKSTHLKVAFLNPVECLDIYFLLNYLFSLELKNLNVDFFTTDPILLKKTAAGLFDRVEFEDYCRPQNLALEQNWIKLLSNDKYQIDPRLLLKIQFHWIDSMGQFAQLELKQSEYHLFVRGPVFSDTYERVPQLKVLPCYSVELFLPDLMT